MLRRNKLFNPHLPNRIPTLFVINLCSTAICPSLVQTYNNLVFNIIANCKTLKSLIVNMFRLNEWVEMMGDGVLVKV